MTRPGEKPAAAPPAPPSVASDFEARLVALEQQMPAWRVAMNDMADEMEDLLGRTERKRRRTQMQEMRDQNAEAGAGVSIEELAKRDPEHARALIRQQSRLLKGGR